MTRLVVFCLLGCAGLLNDAWAATPPSRWDLGVAVGYGERTNPLVGGKDLPLYADVNVAWFGERLFFDNGDLGVTLRDDQWVTVNAVARLNSDRLFFSRTNGAIAVLGSANGADPVFDQVTGVLLSGFPVTAPDRRWAVEAGAELLADGRWGFLELAALHDASGVHDGLSVELLYGYGAAFGRLYLEGSVTAAWKSADVNDYYWGLRESEVPLGARAYEAGSGTNWGARLSAGWQLAPRWSLSAAIEYERMNREASASPIVRTDDLLGFFTGISWRF